MSSKNESEGTLTNRLYDIDPIKKNTSRTVSRHEMTYIGIFLALIAAFTAFDILEDSAEGVPLYHIIPECLTAIIAFCSAIYLFYSFAQSRKAILEQTRQSLDTALSKATEWKELADHYQQGIADGINRQLNIWHLTRAEQDICYLLLKGFSIKEISELRQSSDRTVRQQASEIYKKSGVSGRAQLSAFFLEDLLGPA
ncbi:MAG: LuxR C-terminal-related transcriptional regulator [Bdellovibrionota bacterium]